MVINMAMESEHKNISLIKQINSAKDICWFALEALRLEMSGFQLTTIGISSNSFIAKFKRRENGDFSQIEHPVGVNY